MEEFLCERRSIISFKDGDIFRKYYKYAKKSDVLAEKKRVKNKVDFGRT